MKALAAAPDQRALPFYLAALLDHNQETRDAASRTLVALGDSICSDLRTLHERNELLASVRQKLATLFAANNQFAFLRQEPRAKLEPSAYVNYAADHRGDAARGQQLFADPQGIGCVKCHAVGGVGATNIGPDLLGIGAKYPRDELIRSVLEPSERIQIDCEMLLIEFDSIFGSSKMISFSIKPRSRWMAPSLKRLASASKVWISVTKEFGVTIRWY